MYKNIHADLKSHTDLMKSPYTFRLGSFLIYINDLPNCLSFCHPRMYDDDVHITYAGSDLGLIQVNLNRDLDNLSKWLISNELTLNTTKTEFMLINFRQKLSTLSGTLDRLSIDNVP